MKLTELSPEEKRILAAEACGWTDFSRADFAGAIQYGRKPLSCSASWEVPDYGNDLNAMAGAVMTLGIVCKRVFAETLRRVCDDELPGDILGDEFVIQNATAAQRLDAFLLAKGLCE